MEWNLKREILPLFVLAVFIMLSFYFYPILPATIPSHYDIQGNPNSYSTKSDLIFGLLIGVILIYVILTFIPLIDPFWKKIQARYNIFLIIRDCVLMFFLFIYLSMLLSAQAGSFYKNYFGISFGLFFILLGNYLPKLPRNFFFGIRSPWTLASETVWKKTHVLSGWLFVIGGVVMVILSLLKFPLEIVLLTIILPLVVFSAIVYPFYLFRKLQKEGKENIPEL